MRPLLALCLVAAPHLALADAPKGDHPEGDYGGVVPGQPKKPDPTKGKPKKPPPKGTLAWVGFEAKGGGSEIFLQSVAPFDVTQHVDNGTLVVHLTGLTRLGQNTWRPIDTRFFETPLAKIVARYAGATKTQKAGIDVRVSFKNAKDAKEASLRTATESDGYFYAYLDFAGGAASAAGGDAPATMKDPEK